MDHRLPSVVCRPPLIKSGAIIQIFTPLLFPLLLTHAIILP
jgi:hypothetical protein